MAAVSTENGEANFVRVHNNLTGNHLEGFKDSYGPRSTVIVPTVDEKGAVTLWATIYEFDGHDFVLVAEPQLVAPGEGRAEVELSGASGNRFAFTLASSTLPTKMLSIGRLVSSYRVCR